MMVITGNYYQESRIMVSGVEMVGLVAGMVERERRYVESSVVGISQVDRRDSEARHEGRKVTPRSNQTHPVKKEYRQVINK